jgi:hypothetical protein
MSNINWKEVVAYVLRLIADGLDKKEAISKASLKFAVPKKSIFSKL